MKGKVVIIGLLLLAYLLSCGTVFSASDNPASDSSGWYCPWRGQGRGMHRGPGPGPNCPMSGRCGSLQRNADGQVTQDQARQLVENQLRFWNNPNLHLADFEEHDKYYEAAIVTRDNSFVQKLQVDKSTGWLRNSY